MAWGIPKLHNKKDLISQGEKKVEIIREQFNQGLLTNKERYIKVIEVWSDIKNQITDQSKDVFKADNSISTIINSGARGSWSYLFRLWVSKVW